jgi:predicted thioredoxin/glutaredoxin
MDMIDTTNALQCYPVLEPENVIFAFACSVDCVQLDGKSVVDKLLYQMPGVVGDITSARVSLNRCLDPNTDVNDACVQSVGPVVLQDSKVVLDLEWNRVTKFKFWWITGSWRWQRSPVQTLLNNEVGNSAILCLGL